MNVPYPDIKLCHGDNDQQLFKARPNLSKSNRQSFAHNSHIFQLATAICIASLPTSLMFPKKTKLQVLKAPTQSLAQSAPLPPSIVVETLNPAQPRQQTIILPLRILLWLLPLTLVALPSPLYTPMKSTSTPFAIKA